MSITTIGNSPNTLAAQLQAITSGPFAPSTRNDAATAAPAANGGDSRFVSAIKNAFESLGISLDGSASTSAAGPTSASTTASSTGDGSTTDAAVASFLQSLLAALHSQPAPNGPPPSIVSPNGPTPASASAADPPSAANGTSTASTDAASGTSGTGAAHHHHGHGGHRVENDVRSLLSQLESSDGTTTTAGSTASATSSGTALDTLEKNFNALLAQNGVASTGSNAQLARFLQNLASNLDGAPKTGNVVSTTA